MKKKIDPVETTVVTKAFETHCDFCDCVIRTDDPRDIYVSLEYFALKERGDNFFDETSMSYDMCDKCFLEKLPTIAIRKPDTSTNKE